MKNIDKFDRLIYKFVGVSPNECMRRWSSSPAADRVSEYVGTYVVLDYSSTYTCTCCRVVHVFPSFFSWRRSKLILWIHSGQVRCRMGSRFVRTAYFYMHGMHGKFVRPFATYSVCAVLLAMGWIICTWCPHWLSVHAVHYYNYPALHRIVAQLIANNVGKHACILNNHSLFFFSSFSFFLFLRGRRFPAIHNYYSH